MAGFILSMDNGDTLILCGWGDRLNGRLQSRDFSPGRQTMRAHAVFWYPDNGYHQPFDISCKRKDHICE